jgi:hypothetical protein
VPENKSNFSRLTNKSLLLLLFLTLLFFWKILLTNQFSLLVEDEGVRQTYSWLNHIVMNIRQGTLPLWDPYTGSGSNFSAEMQTGAFSPLNLLLIPFRLNKEGLLWPQSYHWLYAFIHFLGACFMFALARQLKLSRFSAIIAGICFSLGGFVLHVPWPHMYESAIWLPLVFLFFLRALDAQNVKKAILYASASGLAMGMTILAGGLHLAIMEGIVVFATAVFVYFHPQILPGKYQNRSLGFLLLICAAVLVSGFCAGAIQILSSLEYSSRAYRWIGGNAPAVVANAKIPYAYLKDRVSPQALFGMVFPISYGIGGNGEAISPYMGVFPLLAVIIGVVKYWSRVWVRYMAGLAFLAYLYSLGEMSFFYGLLYSIVPYLWMAREAGRFMCLASFAMSILAAFGIEALLSNTNPKSDWGRWNRVLAGIVIACSLVLLIVALFGRPEINPWMAFSILLILLSYGLFQYIIRGNTGISSRVLIVALIFFDIGAFDWSARNLIETESSGGVNHLARLMSCRGAVEFLKSRPGPYRVRIDADPKPNISSAFHVPTVHNFGAAALKDVTTLSGHDTQLLNARYVLKPASVQEPGAIYQDKVWKVYENTKVCPAAWIVHKTTVDPSVEHLLTLLDAQRINLNETAVVSSPLDTALETPPEGGTERAIFRRYEANKLELDVQTEGRGFLVLSEIFYPGWRATVNGNRVQIHKADGILRGIVVPRGQSKVVLRYVPMSIYAGGILSLFAFGGTLIAFVFHWRRRD